MVLISLISNPIFSIDNVKKITVARGGDAFYPPYDMIINDEITGFHIDFVREVAKRLNTEVEFVSYPWRRAVKMLKAGELDAVTYMSKTVEREQFGYFLEGNILSILQDGFFILKDRFPDFKYSGKLTQLEPYIIGLQMGFSYGQSFDDATFLKKNNLAKNETQLI